MKNQLFSMITFWAVMLAACDPCPDCGEPLVYDPLISLKFINQDSADQLSQLIAVNADSITKTNNLRRAYLDSINALSDSLLVIDSLLEAGESKWLSKQSELNFIIDTLGTARDSLSEISRLLTTESSGYSKIVASINTGLLLLSEAIALETQRSIVFEDSAKTFDIPLIYESCATDYRMIIDNQSYEVSFKYTPVEIISEKGIARVIGTELSVSTHTFDSVLVICPTTECISNETSITFYF